MSNFQDAFLVTITEENDTYHYKNIKYFNFMTFNNFMFQKHLRFSSFVDCKCYTLLVTKAFYTYQASIRVYMLQYFSLIEFFAQSFDYNNYGMTNFSSVTWTGSPH